MLMFLQQPRKKKKEINKRRTSRPVFRPLYRSPDYNYLGRHGQRGCVVPLPINVVPAKALGDKFAVAPIRLQVAPVVRDTHRPIAEYLRRKFDVGGMTLAPAGHAITSTTRSIPPIRYTQYRTNSPLYFALRSARLLAVSRRCDPRSREILGRTIVRRGNCAIR